MSSMTDRRKPDGSARMRCCDCARTLALQNAITTPLVVTEVMRHLARRKQEEFWVLLLDTKHRITRKVMIARGTVASCPVAMRDTFREAVRSNATGVIAVHNHPSGDPTPSGDDRRLTARLVSAGLQATRPKCACQETYGKVR